MKQYVHSYDSSFHEIMFIKKGIRRAVHDNPALPPCPRRIEVPLLRAFKQRAAWVSGGGQNLGLRLLEGVPDALEGRRERDDPGLAVRGPVLMSVQMSEHRGVIEEQPARRHIVSEVRRDLSQLVVGRDADRNFDVGAEREHRRTERLRDCTLAGRDERPMPRTRVHLEDASVHLIDSSEIDAVAPTESRSMHELHRMMGGLLGQLDLGPRERAMIGTHRSDEVAPMGEILTKQLIEPDEFADGVSNPLPLHRRVLELHSVVADVVGEREGMVLCGCLDDEADSRIPVTPHERITRHLSLPTELHAF